MTTLPPLRPAAKTATSELAGALGRSRGIGEKRRTMPRRAALPRTLAALAALLPLLPGAARGNDAAGSVAAGGVVLGSERRVAMRKERLFVSLREVRVEYEFLNESADEVSSEVVFPIPEIPPSPDLGAAGIPDLALRVDGAPVAVARDARALLDGEDVTGVLSRAGLDLAAWLRAPDATLRRLPARGLDELVRRGLVNRFTYSRGGGPSRTGLEHLWSTRLSFHWTQRFPPGKVVRVEHAYRPIAGGAVAITDDQLAGACPGAALAERLRARRRPDLPANPPASWVDYVLTTANTWKTPISDFELVVERGDHELVSFCWEGPVEKVGRNRFRAAVRDFVPARELTVYFFPR